jgi:hypothetical protein
MADAGELHHDTAPISVGATMRRGEEIRRYRRPAEKWATIGGGVIIALATGIPLISYLASHTTHPGHSLILVALLVTLYVAIFVTYFVFASRVGVETASRGVSSVSLTRRAFIEWQDVAAFVVDRYTPLSVCVQAERLDGSRVPLNALATWAFSASALYPYCDALNEERRTRLAAE